jgi:hypothetical protein
MTGQKKLSIQFNILPSVHNTCLKKYISRRVLVRRYLVLPHTYVLHDSRAIWVVQCKSRDKIEHDLESLVHHGTYARLTLLFIGLWTRPKIFSIQIANHPNSPKIHQVAMGREPAVTGYGQRTRSRILARVLSEKLISVIFSFHARFQSGCRESGIGRTPLLSFNLLQVRFLGWRWTRLLWNHVAPIWLSVLHILSRFSV